MRFRRLLGAKAAQQPNDQSVVWFNKSCDVNTANKPTENEIKLKSHLALVSSYKVCVAVAWKQMEAKEKNNESTVHILVCLDR